MASWKTIVGVSILGLLVYGGVKITPPFIRYFQVKEAFNTMAHKASKFPREDVKGEILAKVKEIKVPLSEENLEVERDGSCVEIYGQYAEAVTFFNRYTFQLTFYPYVRWNCE